MCTSRLCCLLIQGARMAQTLPRVRLVSYLPILCVESFAASDGPRTSQGQAGHLNSPCMCVFLLPLHPSDDSIGVLRVTSEYKSVNLNSETLNSESMTPVLLNPRPNPHNSPFVHLPTSVPSQPAIHVAPSSRSPPWVTIRLAFIYTVCPGRICAFANIERE
jgi:hypothetical protein